MGYAPILRLHKTVVRHQEKINSNQPMKESVKFIENTSLFSGEWK
jgi:hypothetical protein